MSLATLKKKTAHKYFQTTGGKGNSSAGKCRSLSYIGQSLNGRHLSRSIMRGNAILNQRGSNNTLMLPDIRLLTEDSTQVKQASTNGDAVLYTSKYAWRKRPEIELGIEKKRHLLIPAGGYLSRKLSDCNFQQKTKEDVIAQSTHNIHQPSFLFSAKSQSEKLEYMKRKVLLAYNIRSGL